MTDTDSFEFRLNDRPVTIRGISPHRTLLDYIRSQGLTGAKEGCAEGECGACAVLLVKDGPDGTRFQPVVSCLVSLPMVAGQEVITVEALAAGGRLSDVQRAMAEGGGSQCGYCTPGFIVNMFAEHCRRDGRLPSVDALAGNLCRCTGYRPIRDALLSLGPPVAEPRLARLDHPAPEPAPLRYVTPAGRFSRPRSLADCHDLLASDPQARLVAGNTELGVVANLEGERVAHLIAIDGLAELRSFRNDGSAVEIGCGLTMSEIGDRWTDAPDAIAEWLGLFASPLIRNCATLGGNLATASPVGDSAPLLLALDAGVIVDSREGRREIPLADFFTGYRRTLLRRGEILISVHIPKPLPSQMKFYKIAKRSCDDIGTVTAGIALWRDEDGAIGRARIAFGGAGPRPLRAVSAEEALAGTAGSEEDFGRACECLAASLDPISDHRGSADYRSAVARSLLAKFHWDMSREGVAP